MENPLRLFRGGDDVTDLPAIDADHEEYSLARAEGSGLPVVAHSPAALAGNVMEQIKPALGLTQRLNLIEKYENKLASKYGTTQLNTVKTLAWRMVRLTQLQQQLQNAHRANAICAAQQFLIELYSDLMPTCNETALAWSTDVADVVAPRLADELQKIIDWVREADEYEAEVKGKILSYLPMPVSQLREKRYRRLLAGLEPVRSLLLDLPRAKAALCGEPPLSSIQRALVRKLLRRASQSADWTIILAYRAAGSREQLMTLHGLISENQFHIAEDLSALDRRAILGR